MTSLFWTGDQLVSWDAYDGIKAGLLGILTSGLTGFSLNHADVGGYSTFSLPILGVEFGHKRSKELLLRWMELGVFGCVFRTHEGSMPQENVQFHSDSDLVNHLSFCGKLFQSLKNYKKQLMVEASNYGFPLMRTMFFEFPLDPGNNTHDLILECQLLKEQFMLGDCILVAPVLDAGATQVKVFLPKILSSWTYIWNSKILDFGWTVVDAPIGRPGIFVKSSDLKRKTLLPFIEFCESFNE